MVPDRTVLSGLKVYLSMANPAFLRDRMEDESNCAASIWNPCFSAMGLSVSFFHICSQPVPGYFGADQTLDFMLQAQTGDGNKKVKQVKARRTVAA